MEITRLIAAIDAQIEKLQQARQLLSGADAGNKPSKPHKKRVLSAAARKRIADAQRKRWAATKRASK